jgi:hypothetical protein
MGVHDAVGRGAVRSVEDLLRGCLLGAKTLKQTARSLRRTAALLRSAMSSDSQLSVEERSTFLEAISMLERMADTHHDASREAEVRWQRRLELEGKATAWIDQALKAVDAPLEQLVFVAFVLPHMVQWIRSLDALRDVFKEAKEHLAFRVAQKPDMAAEFERLWKHFEQQRAELRLANAAIAQAIEAGTLPRLERIRV